MIVSKFGKKENKRTRIGVDLDKSCTSDEGESHGAQRCQHPGPSLDFEAVECGYQHSYRGKYRVHYSVGWRKMGLEDCPCVGVGNVGVDVSEFVHPVLKGETLCPTK